MNNRTLGISFEDIDPKDVVGASLANKPILPERYRDGISVGIPSNLREAVLVLRLGGDLVDIKINLNLRGGPNERSPEFTVERDKNGVRKKLYLTWVPGTETI